MFLYIGRGPVSNSFLLLLVRHLLLLAWHLFLVGSLLLLVRHLLLEAMHLVPSSEHCFFTSGEVRYHFKRNAQCFDWADVALRTWPTLVLTSWLLPATQRETLVEIATRNKCLTSSNKVRY